MSRSSVACASHESSSTKVGDQTAIFVEENRSALELGAVELHNTTLASASSSHIQGVQDTYNANGQSDRARVRIRSGRVAESTL